MLYLIRATVVPNEARIVGGAFIDADKQCVNVDLINRCWTYCIIDIDEIDACALVLKGTKMHAVKYIQSIKSRVTHNTRLTNEAIMADGFDYKKLYYVE